MAEVVNKPELVASVQEVMALKLDRKVTKKEAEVVVSTVFDSIQSNLAQGIAVRLTGFGSWEVRERAARKGRNPQTGEEIDIPATNAVHFKAGKGLKEAVK